MKNIRCLDILPTDFIRTLNRIGELRSSATPIISEAIELKTPDMLRVIWPETNGLTNDTPIAIVGNEVIIADLLPRILALPGIALPITALIRTWQSEDFAIGASLRATPLNDISTLGFIGLIIAELRATIGPDVDLKLMGIDSVRRTLSFVCAQAISRGWTHQTLGAIVKRWFETKLLTENEKIPAMLIHVEEYSGFLQQLEQRVAKNDIRERLAIEIQSWISLKKAGENKNGSARLISQVIKALKGVQSRELRYDIIIAAIHQTAESVDPLEPLEHGFLLSLIEPGSLDFLDLAQRSGPNSIAISAAYCIFAAILGGNATLGQFSAFGWNIVRNSNSFSVDMPFDISLSELRILNDTRRPTTMTFRTRSPALIDVELAPTVSGSFGNPNRRRNSTAKAEDMKIEDDRQEILRESVAAAINALEVASRVLQGKKSKYDRNIFSHKRNF